MPKKYNELPFAIKKLGQHFLNDKDIISKITGDFEGMAQAILEIGAGPGILTEKLAGRNIPYHVIEMDQRFFPHLKEHISEDQITMGDALKINLNELIDQLNWCDKKILVVSNLPYNISVPLTLRFVKTPAINMMTLMFQKEVANKIFSTRKKNSMGSLMSLTQTFFDIKPLCQVPPAAFIPPPKVDSSVLSFSRKSESQIPLEKFADFEAFLRLLFSMKRKQVGNILKSQFNAEKLEMAFSESQISATDRAETFNLEQVHILYTLLKNS